MASSTAILKRPPAQGPLEIADSLLVGMGSKDITKPGTSRARLLVNQLVGQFMAHVAD